ncbi:aminotransferase class IV family protein [Prevotellamassilia timonensis]|uniref:aminotransferase class IV family protein n=1 Tax=Prevotellamassilia timonensis TaxID=1852370 RepID=UPI00307B8EC5
MAQQFVETIKIKGGEAQAIAYHQERLERTLRHFFPSLCNATSMPSLEELVAPTADMDFYKARVVYGEQGVKAITYAAYAMREIKSLQVVENDAITYDYKSTDRSSLNALVAQKGECDEIVIVKHGLLTDTSFTNLAIYDGKHWITPKRPLLLGTKRAALLDKGIIQEADITLNDLRNAVKVSLFNAMIEFGEREVPIGNVRF